ncbi:type II toxin-antitoxin system VapC family toxin [Arsenicibacter rosenii]|uniref:Twitching motility protein PilT n=1 Tax=Arsenicibacter rosenii TaxID=1750698 RepID=A0A1S2VP84_9BACT|nr:type II toxin-antitoxin system VapC family toxin [Arsenicibacter rosenii]OIN60075.1 twitching motility protein PilT [Arsenicibacter rosenii]
MQYLIDTHTFLWFVAKSDELSTTARDLLESDHNEIFLSIASLWEISIKNSLGKLAIEGGYETVIDDVIENDITILPVNFAHTVLQNKLPLFHRDPFDRIIVSQSIVEGFNIISRDLLHDPYLEEQTVYRIW